MFVTLFALVTTACVGLLFGRFLSATYRVDLWPAVALGVGIRSRSVWARWRPWQRRRDWPASWLWWPAPGTCDVSA
jgi:hypothetical protein